MEKGDNGYEEEQKERGGVFGHKIAGKSWFSLESWYYGL